MTIDDIRWVFEGGIGDEFRITYYRYYDTSDSVRGGPPETGTFTLFENDLRGVYVKTEYEKLIFIPFTRIYEVTKIL
jgi:hypothetical protein